MGEIDSGVIATALTAFGTLALLFTLGVIARQISLQRKDLEYRIYQSINDRYQDILWRAADDPSLDAVWLPLDEAESDWLDVHRAAYTERALEGADVWPLWSALNIRESDWQGPPPFDLVAQRRIYRLVRSTLEICEQAHFAQSKQSIQPETWDKFEAILESWFGARYFDEVFSECRARLSTSFCNQVERLRHGVRST